MKNSAALLWGAPELARAEQARAIEHVSGGHLVLEGEARAAAAATSLDEFAVLDAVHRQAVVVRRGVPGPSGVLERPESAREADGSWRPRSAPRSGRVGGGSRRRPVGSGRRTGAEARREAGDRLLVERSARRADRRRPGCGPGPPGPAAGTGGAPGTGAQRGECEPEARAEEGART